MSREMPAGAELRLVGLQIDNASTSLWQQFEGSLDERLDTIEPRLTWHRVPALSCRGRHGEKSPAAPPTGAYPEAPSVSTRYNGWQD